MPSTVAQAIAAAAILDYERGSVDELRSLAAMGTGGAHKNNIDRDLRRRLGDTEYGEVAQPTLPLRRLVANPRRYTFVNMRYPVLLPRRTFATLYHHYRAAFNRLMRPSAEALQRFWQDVADFPGVPLGSIAA